MTNTRDIETEKKIHNMEMDITKLKVEVEALTKEKEELIKANALLVKEKEEVKTEYLYKLADLDNATKRCNREKEEYLKYSLGKFMLDLCGVIDDFERLGQNLNDEQREGFDLIISNVKKLLEKYKVEPIDQCGVDFHPELHEALSYEPGDHGKVMKVLKKGYKLHDRLLRPAQVAVGREEKKDE